MIPNTNQMPDLSDLYSILPSLSTATLCFDGTNLTKKEKLYVRLFVRLTNKAIVEYCTTRKALDILVGNTITSDRLVGMMPFIDHMENCLNATRRLFNLLYAAKKECGGLKINRLARRNLGSHSGRIKDIRDAIEHLDEKIQKGERISVNIWFTPDETGVELAGQTLSFSNLSQIMRSFHAMSIQWLDDFCEQATTGKQ